LAKHNHNVSIPTLWRTVGAPAARQQRCRRRHPGAYLAGVAHQQRHRAGLQANEAACDQSSGSASR